MDRKEFLVNLIFHIILMIIVIIMWSIVISLVLQKQIIFIYREKIDDVVISSRESLYFYPIVFVFLMIYNYLLNFLRIKIRIIDFINILIFFISCFICFKILMINY
mgnify:CR=1 FL=1